MCALILLHQYINVIAIMNCCYYIVKIYTKHISNLKKFKNQIQENFGNITTSKTKNMDELLLVITKKWTSTRFKLNYNKEVFP